MDAHLGNFDLLQCFEILKPRVLGALSSLLPETNAHVAAIDADASVDAAVDEA